MNKRVNTDAEVRGEYKLWEATKACKQPLLCCALPQDRRQLVYDPGGVSPNLKEENCSTSFERKPFPTVWPRKEYVKRCSFTDKIVMHIFPLKTTTTKYWFNNSQSPLCSQSKTRESQKNEWESQCRRQSPLCSKSKTSERQNMNKKVDAETRGAGGD